MERIVLRGRAVVTRVVQAFRPVDDVVQAFRPVDDQQRGNENSRYDFGAAILTVLSAAGSFGASVCPAGYLFTLRT